VVKSVIVAKSMGKKVHCVVLTAAISLLTFKPLSHFVQTTQEVMRHVQRITHEIHQQSEVIKKNQSIPTFIGHELFNHYQKIVSPGFKGGNRHTFFTGCNLS
jgi:hypothetical protein